jgi:hypothetical protein
MSAHSMGTPIKSEGIWRVLIACFAEEMYSRVTLERDKGALGLLVA